MVALGLGSSGAALAADQIAYAELNAEFVRLDFTSGAIDDIEPLSDTMLVGAFAGGDVSHEYTVDGFDTFISIATLDAETSLLGQLSITDPPSGMAWDPVAKTMILMTDDAACDNATLYTFNITTVVTQPVGSETGCVKGLAIDFDENAYSIDIDADTLLRFDIGTVGPLGFDASDFEALFFDWTGALYLIATDHDSGLAGLYTVDTQTGAATLLSADGAGYSAFAFAPDPDAIFRSTFQANAGFP